MEKDTYAAHFKRARYEAARRLMRPELADDRALAAREMGISDSQLKQVENGAKRPSFETLLEMARVYNVLPGDLLPSIAPKGAEVDRIMGPLMALAEPTRSLFITQMEAFARMLAAQIAMGQAVSEARYEAERNYGTTASTQITGEPRRAFGLAAADEESPEGPLSDRRHRNQTSAASSAKRRRTE